MTSADHQPRRTGVDARVAAQEARRRWATEVSQALNENRLSINAAAKEMGISPGRLQAWLNQDVEPSPRVMKDLARVIRRSHSHLLQLLDWLPPEMSDAPLRLEATEKLNEAVADARRWLQGATQAAGLHGGSLLAGALLEASHDWLATVRNSIRGQRYPVRYAIRVGFSRVDEEPTPPDDARSAADRSRIEELISDTLVRSSASWLSPERLAGQTWARRPDLVLTVPALCASRPRGLRPNLLVPPSIVVVGIPYAGSQEVAALLADLLDWAYLDIQALTAEQFGLASDAPLEVVHRAQISTARRLLDDPGGVARQAVWSYRDPDPVLQTFPGIGPELPLVILLRPPPSLVAHVTAHDTELDSRHTHLVDAVQHVVRGTLETRRQPRTYLILDVPELPLGTQNPDEVDIVFDSYVELAFQAATWLYETHGAPRLADAQGVLGDLWRRANRQAASDQPTN
jgi:transcriptional regulator with XRE-family HTH domain